MEIIIIILLSLLSTFLYLKQKSDLKRAVDDERNVQAWRIEYERALKLNREELLSPEQLKTLKKLDDEEKQNYEKSFSKLKGLL